MSLNIKNPEAYRLARELSAETGESMTEAVVNALRDRLRAISRRTDATRLLAEVRAVQSFVASLPVTDPRTPEELLYDESGLPR
jgi:antitoxin VapB